MSGLVGVPPISVSPSECLFGQFQLDLGFWLMIILQRRLRVEALCVLAETEGSIYFPRDIVLTADRRYNQ